MQRGDRVGPFQLTSLLGEGGMASVWSARLPGHDLPVAVKLLHPRLQAQRRSRALFLDEVRAVAGLEHPHIGAVLDYGEAEVRDEVHAWLAMEVVSGGSLAALPHRAGWLRVRQALRDVLHALAFVHARGLVHLDIKADNVLLASAVDARPGWKVMDLGIARAMGALSRVQVAGTPSHMPPEQWRGDARAFGPWTDIYAVGCMTWRLLTGRRAFPGDLLACRERHLRGAPTPLPDHLSPAIRAWLHRCVAVEPADRFGSARQAAQALAEVASVLRAPTERPAPSEPATLATTLALSGPLAEAVADDPADEATTLAERPAPAVGPRRPRPVTQAEAVPWPRPLVGLPSAFLELGAGLVALRQPALVGRDATCEALWEQLQQVREDGLAQVTSLVGPAGVGKSRLARWLVTRAVAFDQARALWVDGPDWGDVGRGIARADRLFDLSQEEVRAALAEDGLPEDHIDLLLPLFGDEPPAAATAVPAVLHWLAHGAQPWVLVFERPGPALAPLLRALAAEELPVLAVVEADEEAPGLPATTVEPLAAGDVHRVLDALLPLEPTTRASVVAAADGLPGRAVARVVEHVEAGAYRRGPRGVVFDALGAVEEARTTRVARLGQQLDEATWGALVAAAAWGAPLRRSEWEQLTGPTLTPAVMGRIARGGWMVRHADRTWSWSDRGLAADLRDVLADEPAMARLHQRCASVRQARGGAPLATAEHLLRAKRPEAAVPFLVQAAEAARASGDHDRHALVTARLGQAVASCDPVPPMARVRHLFERTRVLTYQQSGAQAVPVAAEAWAAAEAHGDPDGLVLAACALATAHRAAGDGSDATERLASVLARHGERLSPRERVRAQATLGIGYADLARHDVAREHLKAALHAEILRPAQQGDLWRALAKGVEDRRLRGSLLARAVEAFREGGSLVGAGAIAVDQGNDAANHGELDAAEAHYREGLHCFELVRSPHAFVAHLLLSNTLRQSGRWGEMARHAAAALALTRRYHSGAMGVLAQGLLLAHEARRGDLEAVEGRIDALLEARRAGHRPPDTAMFGACLQEATTAVAEHDDGADVVKRLDAVRFGMLEDAIA